MDTRFEALSRLCLNNWHYIDRQILSFNRGINFFTGHSGSGKSTVIDALQVLLYANTDGRGFFNKAAAGDSDRTLLEYLRGMISIGGNNEYTYLRNKKFSSTIVMELTRTDTGEAQCIGVVFDVDPASDSTSWNFFRHTGPLLPCAYRTKDRAMSVEEVKSAVRSACGPEDCCFEKTNERFRRKLYDVYLGGLDPVRFPKLFKRAIPFKMDMKLADFVKEYICLEKDIDVESMQESVIQYGRMRRRICDICDEVAELEGIRAAYAAFAEKRRERDRMEYLSRYFGLLESRRAEEELRLRLSHHRADLAAQQKKAEEISADIRVLEKKKEELTGRIAASGYDALTESLRLEGELIQKLEVGRASWQKTARGLMAWEERDITPNQVLWDIDAFQKEQIGSDGLARLCAQLSDLHADAQRQKSDADGQLRRISAEKKELNAQLKELRQGRAAYPEYLENARKHLKRELKKRTGTDVPVDVLADLIEVEHETWRNAVEGYMGNNKLLLVVPPDYSREAMDIYSMLDPAVFHQAAVLDTERAAGQERSVRERALSREVRTSVSYVRAYIDFLLGNVIKCASVDELRRQSIGITSRCELYAGFKLQHINPANYTRFAYIGEMSRRQRIRALEEQLETLKVREKPLLAESREAEERLSLEALSGGSELYVSWLGDIRQLDSERGKQEALLRELAVLKDRNVDAWQREKEETDREIKRKNEAHSAVVQGIGALTEAISSEEKTYLTAAEQLQTQEKDFRHVAEWDEQAHALATENRYANPRQHFLGRSTAASNEAEAAASRMRQLRVDYLKKRPNRSFDSEAADNTAYDALLERLRRDDLDALQEKAARQAVQTADFFKYDFVFKIRSAIKEALKQRDELNRIIGQMDFGKDRYRFVIERNKGADGRFYPMLMDENLSIHPGSLSDRMDNQLDLFTMSHESAYGGLIEELLSIFMPPENATAAELEEAKANMHKYADYRTYLSFDMVQTVGGADSKIQISLDQTIRKNSGGEGQNPLYIVLLASFMQIYRIGGGRGGARRPAFRLVVLDEAFSKMDAEKVAGCIALMRNFGFQAIVSSTNDKIQSYLESVDKTFVFANPDKRHISIAGFEKEDFKALQTSVANV